MYINFVMLEASLQKCRSYVEGQVLDIGCGFRPYEFSYYRGASKYIGLDYLTDRSKPDVIGSALDLPFGEKSMDTVVSNETLEHVPDPARAVVEMYRVLKPEGYLILSCPAFWPRHEQPYDYFRYPYDGIISLVEGAGFRIETLFCRGRTYAFLGQVLQHTGVSLLKSALARRILNSVFLRLDRRKTNDILTLGWTVLARRGGEQ
jgi:SAM-dependent methyltransferase